MEALYCLLQPGTHCSLYDLEVRVKGVFRRGEFVLDKGSSASWAKVTRNAQKYMCVVRAHV